MKSLYPAALGLALAGSVEAAAWPPVNGDLVLGVQATAGTGSTSNVFVNLGPAFQIRENAEQGSVVNIAAELSAAFGANWFSRTDLWFGVAGNRSALSTPSEVNGDANRVVYVSRAAGSPGASILFSGYTSNALGSSGNNIQSLVGAAATLVTRGKGVITMTQTANPTPWFNSWSKWNPTPGAAFAIFTGGIQNNFGKASNATPLVDIQRLTASGVTREATVGITRSGDVIVSNTPSVFTAAKAIADLLATQYYVGDSVNVNVGAGLTIAGGLPLGVTYNATTGLVSGTITGLPATTGLVTVKSGTTTLATLENFRLNVAQYPFLGSYDVLVQDGDSTPAGLPEGRIRFTITKPGTFSASAVKKGSTTAVALTGTFTPTATSTTVQLTLAFSNGISAVVNLSSTSNVVTGTLTEAGQTNVDTLSGFRAASGPAASRALTASLATTGGDRTSVPAGFGYATGSLGMTGSATFAGTLGDGQKFTTSFNASLTDQAVVYVQPYSSDVVNSFFGGIINLPNLGQRTSTGAASFGLSQTNRPAAGLKWRKTAIAGSSYDAGFGPLDVAGAVSSFTPVPAGIKAPGDRLAAQLGAKGNTFVATYANAGTTPADSSAANPDALLDNENEALPDTYLMGVSPITFNDPSITGRFQNEVQVVTITGSVGTGYDMTVKFGATTSASFSYSPSASTLAGRIQTALENIGAVGVGNVTVTADTANIFRITFIGARGYQDIAPLMFAKAGGGTGLPTFGVSELVKGTGNALTSITVDEVQRVAVASTVSTFALSFKGFTTAAITRSETQATTVTNIQNALQALTSIGLASNVAVTSAGLDGTTQLFNVTLQGALGKSDQLAMMTTTAGVTVSELAKGGAVATRVSGTVMGLSGTFSASVLLNNAGLKGTVEGVFLQDDSFGTVNGRGQVRIPVAAGLNQDFQTIPVTLSTN